MKKSSTRQRSHSLRRRRLFVECLEPRQLLAADFQLLRDINTAPSTAGSDPNNFVEVNGIAYFAASTSTTGGIELWKSDGTAAGTVLVKDIYAGLGNSDPRYLTNVNGTLFFKGRTESGGLELWKSDGTAAGTVQVKDIYAGLGNSDPRYLTNVNGTLFFIANDGANGTELWKSDGTASGTVQVKDINTGPFSSNPGSLTIVNGTLFFRATESNDIELWKSDGTTTGTVQVKDIFVGTGSSTRSNPNNLTNVNGTLYFNASDAAGGNELWKSNGTAAGTVQVKDINTGTASSIPNKLVNVNGTLFFSATDAAGGTELWKSNGTGAGTVQVKDINTGTANSTPGSLTNVNGTLFFSATDAAGGTELWKSNGTPAGTVQVKDINTGTANSTPGSLTIVNGTLFFSATNPAGGIELWKSDGTTAGTVQVKDINSGTASSNPGSLTNVNGTLFFSATDAAGGNELWKSDGTAAGTVQVKNINAGTANSVPSSLTNVNGTLYFIATDAAGGSELWKSNGTAAGTVQVKDINAGTSSSNPNNLVNVNGTLYFGATDAAGGTELWKSDGTESGTVQVKDINSGTANSSPFYLTNVNGILYFNAMDAAGGTELWKSDGTAAGTVQVKDIIAGTTGSGPRNLTNVNGTLFFSPQDVADGFELWKSDGTAAGTMRVKDIFAGTTGSEPSGLTNVNGTLFFRARDATGGFELWKSDGTALGTIQLKDIYAGTVNSYLNNLTNVNGTLYFSATDPANGEELWKSDGTTTGTVQVKDIFVGAFGSGPANLTNVNGTLLFSARDAVGGVELWKSDGTAAGTIQVKDINTGPGFSQPLALSNVSGWLVFQANDAINGQELWVSDGSEAGTKLLAEGVPGAAGSLPTSLIQLGSQILLVANSDDYGQELWRVDGPPVGVSLSGNNLTIDVDQLSTSASVSIVVTAGGVIVTDSANGITLFDSSVGFPTSATRIEIIGSPTISESLTIDHSSGLIDLPFGIAFDGAGGNDTLTVIGMAQMDVALSQSQTGLKVATSTLSGGVEIDSSNLSAISLSSVRRVEAIGSIEVDIPITVAHQLPFALGSITHIAGGSLSSNGTVSLGSGESLLGAGNVAGRISADAGSLIRADGNLTLGNAASVAGFLSRGEIEVGQFTLTVLDANQAVLGSLTSLGTVTQPGNLVSANGALIDFGNNLVGYGTLNTPNLASKPTIINGSVEGTSLANPITLAGYTKGVGSLNNVAITGTYSPGFSPAAVILGSVSYAPSSITTVELGGTVAGSQYDQLNHIGQAILGGTLDLDFINGFQPSIGNSFTIMTATEGISGTFANTQLPTLASGLEWSINYGAQSVVVTIIETNLTPTDFSLSPQSMAENQSIGATVGLFTSTDPNAADTHTYLLVSGAGDVDNAKFAIAGDALITNASFNFETQTHFSIRVRTTDQGGLWLEKTLVIEVTDVNDAPTFGQSSYPFSVNSKALLGSTVGFVSATDSDMGNSLTYTIVGGNALGAFAINPTSGRITILDSTKLPTIVAPATSVNAPVLTVQVSDGSLIDTASVTVTLNLTPQAMTPIAAAKVTTFNFKENNVVGATAAALAANPAYSGQQFANWTVSATPGGPASSNFYVKSVTATGVVIGVNAKLNFENQNSYLFYVTVSDSLDSTKIVTTPVTINVTDGNDSPQLSLTNGLAGSPTFTSGTPIALVSKYTINEYAIATAGNTPKNGDVLFTLNAQDEDQTSSSLVYAMTGVGVTNPSSGVFVDRTGAMKFDAATRQVTVLDATKLDYERFKTGIPVVLTVADNGLPGSTPTVLTSKATVIMLLNDLNDAPTFATPTLTVVKAENNLANTLLLKALATDGDNLDSVTQPLTYSLVSVMNGTGANVTNLFSIHPTTGEIKVIAAKQFDFELLAKRRFTLTVRATESGASGLTTAQSVLGDQVITLNITDANDAPTFATPTLTVVKAENNLANALVTTVLATDGDTLDGVTQPLVYSLVSALDGTGANVKSRFSINPTTGEIRVIPGNQFDFESPAKKHFTLTLRATESEVSGLTTAQSVIGDQVITLNVTDVNERPTAIFTPVTGSPSVGSTGSVTVNLPDVSVGSSIGSLAITDPDILAALATFGPDTIVVTLVDGSSTTAPAFTYVANSNPTTGGSLRVNNLTTLQSKVGNPFIVRFIIKDKNGLTGALSFTLALTINVTNETDSPT